MKDNKLLLYGVHFAIISAVLYAAAYSFGILSLLLCKSFETSRILLVLSFAAFTLFGLFVIVNIFLKKAHGKNEDIWLVSKPLENIKICVGMTAYNDEESIGVVVKDFKNQKNVIRVIAVDNNSTDKTSETALAAGAEVHRENLQGYGSCCIRALKEAAKTDCNVICLVEGDNTFSGRDLEKLSSYIENADMVLGTRTTKELITSDSQMNLFMYWGNIFMSKVLQVRFMSARLTDVGCTYRIIRKEALEKIICRFTVTGNYFLCDMMLLALKNKLKVIEVPVTFKKRIGKSKGVGGNIFKGFINGSMMWFYILFK